MSAISAPLAWRSPSICDVDLESFHLKRSNLRRALPQDIREPPNQRLDHCLAAL
jgi:hypothetical protein